MKKQKGFPSFRQLQRDIVAHMVESRGFSSKQERQAAFNNSGLKEPIKTLIDKVTNHAYKVTDNDINAVKNAGITEDEIFELVICAAIGQASRQYTNALSALDQVITEKEGGNYAS